MNLQQLQYFTTVARLQNLSRAADLLHVSQSSLSKQISRLEEEFGYPLFDRNGRKISINRAGLRFLTCSSKVLQEVESAKEDIRILCRGDDRRIRVGMAGVPSAFLSEMAAFSQQYPEAEFECCQGLAFEESADINDYDVMIYPDDIKYEKLKGYPYYEEQYYLAFPSDGSPAKTAVSPDELQGKRLVFLRGKKGTAEYAFHVMNALAIPLSGVSFVNSRQMHQRMIAQGMAAGFVPKEEAESYRMDRGIRLYAIVDRRFTRPMKICFRREKYLTGLALKFRDYLTERIKICSQ